MVEGTATGGDGLHLRRALSFFPPDRSRSRSCRSPLRQSSRMRRMPNLNLHLTLRMKVVANGTSGSGDFSASSRLMIDWCWRAVAGTTARACWCLRQVFAEKRMMDEPSRKFRNRRRKLELRDRKLCDRKKWPRHPEKQGRKKRPRSGDPDRGRPPLQDIHIDVGPISDAFEGLSLRDYTEVPRGAKNTKREAADGGTTASANTQKPLPFSPFSPSQRAEAVLKAVWHTSARPAWERLLADARDLVFFLKDVLLLVKRTLFVVARAVFGSVQEVAWALLCPQIAEDAVAKLRALDRKTPASTKREKIHAAKRQGSSTSRRRARQLLVAAAPARTECSRSCTSDGPSEDVLTEVMDAQLWCSQYVLGVQIAVVVAMLMAVGVPHFVRPSAELMACYQATLTPFAIHYLQETLAAHEEEDARSRRGPAGFTITGIREKPHAQQLGADVAAHAALFRGHRHHLTGTPASVRRGLHEESFLNGSNKSTRGHNRLAAYDDREWIYCGTSDEQEPPRGRSCPAAEAVWQRLWERVFAYVNQGPSAERRRAEMEWWRAQDPVGDRVGAFLERLRRKATDNCGAVLEPVVPVLEPMAYALVKELQMLDTSAAAEVDAADKDVAVGAGGERPAGGRKGRRGEQKEVDGVGVSRQKWSK